MKYAIYDKAANGYLTEMDFDIVLSNDTKFRCALTEYITNAKLLDTKEAAIDVVTRIEGFKFMEKGRFVSHSFDDTLNDQYIISEAGNPTKVVDNITVDLDGTVNVKHGTMLTHWSTASLEYAINRMNALQKAASAIYTSWNNTFMIYKVITIIDENEHTHNQFVNVTITGLVKYEKEEEKLLVVGKELTDVTDLLNKRIKELEKANYEPGEQLVERGAVANRLLDENNSLKTKVESIKKEARDWKTLYENANTKLNALKNAIDIIYDDRHSDNMCKDLKHTYDYIHNFSELHDIKILNDNDDNGMPIYITANVEFRYIIDKIIAIVESRELSNINKESKKLISIRDSLAEVIFAIRNAIYHNDSDTFDCIISRMKIDSDFNSDPFMAGVRENIKDICAAEKKNIANHDLKNGEIARLSEERDKAIERAEFYKRQANSIYGMTVPTRCCGKQVMADILSGKKIPVDKKKYDDLVEYVSNINLTYDTIFCMMYKPVYLSTITESLNDLIK